jgi:hypothetical protein
MDIKAAQYSVKAALNSPVNRFGFGAIELYKKLYT